MIKTALYAAEEPGRYRDYVFKHGPYAGWTYADVVKTGGETIAWRVLRNGKRIKMPHVHAHAHAHVPDYDWEWWLQHNTVGVTHEHQQVSLPVRVANHKDNRDYLHKVSN